MEEDDLYSPLREDRSNYLGQRIVKNWENEVKRCEKKKDNSKPSLFRVLYKCFGRLVMNTGLVLFVLEFGIRYSNKYNNLMVIWCIVQNKKYKSSNYFGYYKLFSLKKNWKDHIFYNIWKYIWKYIENIRKTRKKKLNCILFQTRASVFTR